MNTLHLFGDSFTEGHKLDLTFPWYKVWREWRGGNLPPVWYELLSEKINMKCCVYAVGGSSNIETFHKICQNSNFFQKGDIIIINWTYNSRFRWASSEHDNDGKQVLYDGKPIYKWVRLSSNNGEHDFHHITKSTKNEISVKRFEHPFYIDEIYDYEKIIDTLCKSIGCCV